jgi:hypothetical protein
MTTAWSLIMDFNLTSATAILERTPVTIREWLPGLPSEWVTSTGDRGDWGPFDVVGHLIHGEETDWIPRARMILEVQDSRPFPSFDREAQFAASIGKDLEQLVDEFRDLRQENLATLQGWNLTFEDLEKPGEHPELGPVTLRQLLATWAVHDLGHLAQIARSMARHYEEEVGPWKEYLPILHHHSS